jgi:hypothetical protein
MWVLLVSAFLLFGLSATLYAAGPTENRTAKRTDIVRSDRYGILAHARSVLESVRTSVTAVLPPTKMKVKAQRKDDRLNPELTPKTTVGGQVVVARTKPKTLEEEVKEVPKVTFLTHLHTGHLAATAIIGDSRS